MASATSGVPWSGDGETVVGEAGGPAAWAEVGYACPVEFGVGQQAPEPGGALGPKLGVVSAQVVATVPPPGARGDTERAVPVSSDSIGSTRGVSELGLDGVGDLVGERARRRQRRLLLERGGFGEAEGVDRVTQQRHLELQGMTVLVA